MGDACDPDKDNDGLPNTSEYGLFGCPNETLFDSDGDRATDGYESVWTYNPCSASSIPPYLTLPDGDGDYFQDGIERYGYNTCISTGDTFPGWTGCAEPRDSDNDGCSDMQEILDINGDRKVSVGDQTALAKRAAGWPDYTGDPVSDAIYDINKDGRITVGDQTLMAKGTCNYRPYQIGCPICPAGH